MVTTDLSQYPTAWELFRPEKLRQESGVRDDWQFVMVPFEVAIDDVVNKSCGEVAQVIHARRVAALHQMAQLLEKECAKQCQGRPHDWRAVVLEGWWMRETRADKPGQMVVYIDAVYRLEPIHKPAARHK